MKPGTPFFGVAIVPSAAVSVAVAVDLDIVGLGVTPSPGGAAVAVHVADAVGVCVAVTVGVGVLSHSGGYVPLPPPLPPVLRRVGVGVGGAPSMNEVALDWKHFAMGPVLTFPVTLYVPAVAPVVSTVIL